MENKFLSLLRSRKFWAALVGLIVTSAKALDPQFPLDEAQLADIVFILVAYIIGTGMERPAPAA